MTARAAAAAAALFGALLHIGCASDTRYGGSTGTAGAGGSPVAGRGGDSGGTAGSGGQAGAAGVGGTGTGSAGATGGASAGGAPAGGAGGIGGGTGGTGGSQSGGRGGAAAGTSGSAAGGAGGKAGAGGAASTTLTLEYATSSPTATIFGVRITNAGPATPLLSVIRARYFFSDDSTNKMNGATLDSATWHIAGGADIDVRASGGCAVFSTFPSGQAFSYADIGCSLSSPLNASDTLTFTVHFDPTTQAAANDYSYLATSGTFQTNGRMLLLQNGLIVSGTPPF